MGSAFSCDTISCNGLTRTDDPASTTELSGVDGFEFRLNEVKTLPTTDLPGTTTSALLPYKASSEGFTCHSRTPTTLNRAFAAAIPRCISSSPIGTPRPSSPPRGRCGLSIPSSGKRRIHSPKVSKSPNSLSPLPPASPASNVSVSGRSTPIRSLSPCMPQSPLLQKPGEESRQIRGIHPSRTPTPTCDIGSNCSWVPEDAVVPLDCRRRLDELAELEAPLLNSCLILTARPLSDDSNGAKVIRVKLRLNKGAIYHGLVSDSYLQGVGSMSWPDGCFYIGEWKRNQPHGNGLFVRPNGAYYIGQWDDGAAHGVGTFFGSTNNLENGETQTIYRGEWSNDRRVGVGVMLQRDGTTYFGPFNDFGEKNGIARYQWPDNSILDGVWSNDFISGVACFRGTTLEYKGQYDENLMHGIGQFRGPEVVYQGEYWKGKRHGFGMLSWENGNIFMTNWNAGKQDGEGMFINPEGITTKAVWESDQSILLN